MLVNIFLTPGICITCCLAGFLTCSVLSGLPNIQLTVSS